MLTQVFGGRCFGLQALDEFLGRLIFEDGVPQLYGQIENATDRSQGQSRLEQFLASRARCNVRCIHNYFHAVRFPYTANEPN